MTWRQFLEEPAAIPSVTSWYLADVAEAIVDNCVSGYTRPIQTTSGTKSAADVTHQPANAE
jgi:hypothetical protein